MAYFITKRDILDVPVVFSRGVEEEKIQDDLIESVAQKHILPILGEDFYDDIVANPSNYDTLKTYLLPVVANFIKYYILPDIHSEVSTAGINTITGQNKQPVPLESLATIRQSTLDAALLQGQRLLKYLTDNEDDLPLYSPGANPQNRVEIVGGMVFDKLEGYEDIDDYYYRNQ